MELAPDVSADARAASVVRRGAIAVTALAGLLGWLYTVVRDLDFELADTWGAASRLASNTANTWQLRPVALRLQKLLRELEHVDGEPAAP